MSDDNIKAAYQRHVRSVDRGGRASCPSPDALARLASGTSSDAIDLRALDHVFSCELCCGEFELLRAVSQSTHSQMQSRRTGISWSRLALAATVLLAVGLGGESWRQSRAEVQRGTGGAVEAIAPLQTVPRRSMGRFVWHAVAGAATYRIEVLDTEGGVLVSRITSDTILVLSNEERLLVQRAGSFDWSVSARRTDGNERRSNLLRVRAVD